MSLIQTTETEVKYLTDEQVTALFRVIHSTRDKALFRLIYHRGLRASEPGLLELKDWDAGNGSIWIRRKKGSESGRFYLLPVEATALRCRRRRRSSARDEARATTRTRGRESSRGRR